MDLEQRLRKLENECFTTKQRLQKLEDNHPRVEILSNPNSSISKTLKQNTTASRRR